MWTSSSAWLVVTFFSLQLLVSSTALLLFATSSGIPSLSIDLFGVLLSLSVVMSVV